MLPFKVGVSRRQLAEQEQRMRAFVFPGQGSQAVGMGAALAKACPAAKAVLDEVDEALHQPLSRIMAEGPEDTLRLTENAQPALMAASLAVVRALEEQQHPLSRLAGFVAGHSLGEYSALAAAGALDVGVTAKILRLRGQAMQRAVPVGQGAMAALLGLDFATAETVCREAAGDGVCTPANDNAPGQVVISGHKAAVERAMDIAKAKGAKRALLLPVSAPFHCPLMQPAAEEMKAALADLVIAPPCVPIVVNVTATPTSEPEDIRRLLVEQVTGVVRWRESVIALSALGVNTVVECGTGRVLTGLTKRIAPSLTALALETSEDIEAFLANL